MKLTKLLRDIKDITGPKLLHIVTIKGKGLEMAEKQPVIYHAPPSTFDKKTGELINNDVDHQQVPPNYQIVFGKTIIELALQNPKIIGITPAMLTGCSLDLMMKQMPHRVFDVGIAEQHAVTFAAGLATEGFLPFCNIYSTFMQRAYDQLIHDVALQKLNVVFCLDRAGLVGEDGPTHHGAFDLAYLRAIPELTICSPMNEQELRDMMYTAQLNDKGPFVIRYPRGKGVMTNWQLPFSEIEVGKGRIVRQGKDVAIISIGHIGNEVIKACHELEKKEITITHVDIRFLKPLDNDLLINIFRDYSNIVTVEDGTIKGGLGSAVIELMNKEGFNSTVVSLGIPDKFIEHGTQRQLWNDCGYDAVGIENIVLRLIKKIKAS